jgi:hypothetical protein
MNATTILLIIEIIKLLQAREMNEAAAKKAIDSTVKGTDSQKALVLAELQTLNLSFVGKLIKKLLNVD